MLVQCLCGLLPKLYPTARPWSKMAAVIKNSNFSNATFKSKKELEYKLLPAHDANVLNIFQA